MACEGLPLFTSEDPPCQHYTCSDPEGCVPMKFVFAPHYIKNGVVQKGADGAYVPAVTVCQLNITTDPIGRVNRSKSRYFGL